MHLPSDACWPRMPLPAVPITLEVQMEATHEHATSAPARRRGPAEDWTNEEFAESWLQGQAPREAERRRQFVTVRAVIPKLPDQEFRYLNLGAGPGNLDEVLLERFQGAQATLVDCS